MDQYEKNVDKAAKTLESLASGANRVRNGCIAVLANLFFAAFCLWGVYAGYNSWQLQTNGVTTTAVVTSLDEQSDSEGGCCTYVPVLEYTVNGQNYTIRGNTASSPPQYRVGEKVSILYDPSTPEKAQINNWTERWLMPVLLIPAMLIAALVLNFFMLRASRRGESIFA